MNKNKILIIGSSNFSLSLAHLLCNKQNQIIFVDDKNKKIFINKSQSNKIIVIKTNLKNPDEAIKFINEKYDLVFVCLPALLMKVFYMFLILKNKE